MYAFQTRVSAFGIHYAALEGNVGRRKVRGILWRHIERTSKHWGVGRAVVVHGVVVHANGKVRNDIRQCNHCEVQRRFGGGIHGESGADSNGRGKS